MSRPELSDTLTELITALDAPADGATVIEASLETPMEISFTSTGSALTFRAAPARSRFVTGVMAPVHRVTLTAERVRTDK